MDVRLWFDESPLLLGGLWWRGQDLARHVAEAHLEFGNLFGFLLTGPFGTREVPRDRRHQRQRRRQNIRQNLHFFPSRKLVVGWFLELFTLLVTLSYELIRLCDGSVQPRPSQLWKQVF